MSAQQIADHRRRMLEAQVPWPLHDGLVHYLVAHRPVGSFLTAVLSNDLMGAVARGDDTNRAHLHHIVSFLLNYAPDDCWGTPARVETWLNGGTRT